MFLRSEWQTVGPQYGLSDISKSGERRWSPEVSTQRARQAVGGVRRGQYRRGGHIRRARERQPIEASQRNPPPSVLQAGADDLSRARCPRAGTQRVVSPCPRREGREPIRERDAESAA